MVKANPLYEFAGDFFYKDMSIVLVKMPDRDVIKHYYKITDQGTIEIYPRDSKEAILNPKLRGDEVTIDPVTRKKVYKWVFGAPFFTSLFSNEPSWKQVFTDDDFFKIWGTAETVTKRQFDTKQPQKGMDLTMVLICVLGIMVLVLLVINFLIAQKTGAIELSYLLPSK